MAEQRITPAGQARGEIDALLAHTDREVGEVWEEVAGLSVWRVL